MQNSEIEASVRIEITKVAPLVMEGMPHLVNAQVQRVVDAYSLDVSMGHGVRVNVMSDVLKLELMLRQIDSYKTGGKNGAVFG